MQIRHIGLWFVLLLIAVFSAANWATLVRETELNLLMGQVQAPFGLVMLGAVVIMGFLYAVLLLLGERRLLKENSRLSRELSELREAEPSLDAETVRSVVAGELLPIVERLDQMRSQPTSGESVQT